MVVRGADERGVRPMYRCEHCGAIFEEPLEKRWKEPMPDGFFEPWCVDVCPDCGEEGIEELFEEVVDDEDE